VRVHGIVLLDGSTDRVVGEFRRNSTACDSAVRVGRPSGRSLLRGSTSWNMVRNPSLGGGKFYAEKKRPVNAKARLPSRG
jgi:hypothetical protein